MIEDASVSLLLKNKKTRKKESHDSKQDFRIYKRRKPIIKNQKNIVDLARWNDDVWRNFMIRRKKMTTKKKMIISISAISAVLILAIIAVVAVWAATRTEATGTINITYTANDIAGEVSAQYSTGYEDDGVTNTWTELGATSFDGFEADGTSKALGETADITVPSATKFVIFEFKFTNLTSETAYTANVTFTGGTTFENITMKVLDAGTTQKTQLGRNDFSTALTSGTASTDYTVAAGSEGTYVYVLVEPTVAYEDATFAGTFSWDMNVVE